MDTDPPLDISCFEALSAVAASPLVTTADMPAPAGLERMPPAVSGAGASAVAGLVWACSGEASAPDGLALLWAGAELCVDSASQLEG